MRLTHKAGARIIERMLNTSLSNRSAFGISILISFLAAVQNPAAAQSALRVISVDFSRLETIAYGPPSPTYTGPSAYGSAGADYWNRFEIATIMGNPPSQPTITNATSTPLKAADGVTQTPVTVSLGAFRVYWSEGNPTAQCAPDLYNDYAWALTSDGPGQFFIEHLVPGRKYSLYLYAQAAGWADYGAAFTVSNPSATSNPQESPGADPTGFTEGENYALFRDVVADSNGRIAGSWQTSSLTADPSEGDFNGLTIVSTSGQDVEVINVDFDTAPTPRTIPATPILAQAGAVAGDSGSFWNGVGYYATNGTRSVTSPPLRLSDGTTPTTVTITLTNMAFFFTDNPSAAAAPDLLNDYFVAADGSGPAVFRIEHLRPGGSYDLYLFGSAAGYDSNGAEFRLENSSLTPSPQSTSGLNSPAFEAGVNYVVFTNVVASAQGMISGSWGPSGVATDQTEGEFNGLQIVSVADFPSPAFSLSNPRFVGGQFQFELQTQTGVRYLIEYKESLGTDAWSALETVVGTGANVLVKDSAPTNFSRFYRAKMQ
jgi:hypothetical protein